MNSKLEQAQDASHELRGKLQQLMPVVEPDELAREDVLDLIEFAESVEKKIDRIGHLSPAAAEQEIDEVLPHLLAVLEDVRTLERRFQH
jgi:hypothetical protein